MTAASCDAHDDMSEQQEAQLPFRVSILENDTVEAHGPVPAFLDCGFVSCRCKTTISAHLLRACRYRLPLADSYGRYGPVSLSIYHKYLVIALRDKREAIMFLQPTSLH